MFMPAVCLTCGAAVGDVAEIFLIIRAGRLREKLAASRELPQSALSNLELDIDMSDVFEKLMIEDCDYCRAQLATTMRWNDEH